VDLTRILNSLPRYESERILVGFETSDDAAVYLISDDLAVIQTVDFFTPIVNDPYLFGQITASNALSDIYAMGVEPSIALSLVAYPCKFGMDILSEIVRGGIDKMSEAGVLVLGGHSVEDDEPKYGFVVTGFAKPDEIIKNSTAKPGNLIYATKPLGTGVIATGIKADIVSEEEVKDQIEAVLRLNKKAKDAAVCARATALTDITGFGLAGHVFEMAKGSGLSVEIYTSNVKFNQKALELASMGIMPAGLHDNKRYLQGAIVRDEGIDDTLFDLLFDPQTAGGLLIAVEEENANKLEEELGACGEVFYLAGRFLEEGKTAIHFRK
jgi:selenide,water dikinase